MPLLATSAKVEQLMFSRMKFSSSVCAVDSTWQEHEQDISLIDAVYRKDFGCYTVRCFCVFVTKKLTEACASCQMDELYRKDNG